MAYAVYGAIALLSLIVILPASPFMHKMHHVLTLIAAASLALSLIVTWTSFAFDQEAPMKVFFKQNYHVDAYNGSAHAITTLTGARSYLQKHIMPELPSTWGSHVNCSASQDARRSGLVECSWPTHLLPAHGSSLTLVDASFEDSISLIEPSPSDLARNWLKVQTTKTSPTSAILSVQGTNTRSCRLYFDSTPVTYYNVTTPDTNGQLQPGYEIPEDGIKELRLWSRTWDRAFEVEVEWKGASGGSLEGRASCLWNEYASGAAGGPGSGGRIPAYEEVLAFIPKWAAATKRDDGLVETWTTFRV
jgi:hypothetical protein